MKRRLLINLEEEQFDWIRSQAINKYCSYSEIIRQLISPNIKNSIVEGKISSNKDIEIKRAEMVEDLKVENTLKDTGFHPISKDSQVKNTPKGGK